MQRINNKLDKSSDFDDYDDDLSNLGHLNSKSKPIAQATILQPQSNINKRIDNSMVNMNGEKTQANKEPVNKFRPPPIAHKLPSPRERSEIIESKDKPVTMRTGPVADPEPYKQNLRLDTEQKQRFGIKKKVDDVKEPSEKSEYSDEISDKGIGRDEAFITQPQEDSDQGYNDSVSAKKSVKRNIDKDREPVPIKPPKKKNTIQSIPGYADEDPDQLFAENSSLITQLLEFTDQMDDRMVLLKKVKKVDQQLERPSSALTGKKQQLDAMARKAKLIKHDVDSMNKILENSYKVDSVVDKENQYKEQERIIEEQRVKLKDYKKMIKEQKKFIREREQFENAGARSEGVDKIFVEAKEKLKKLKTEYTEEDKRLKEQHNEVQIMKERNKKIQYYIQEKRRIENETGVKQDITQQDIDEEAKKIEELELDRKNLGKI